MSRLDFWLFYHPSPTLRQFIAWGFSDGLLTGLITLPLQTFECANLLSATSNALLVHELLQVELAKWFVIGPLLAAPFSMWRVSPICVVKGKFSNKHHLIYVLILLFLQKNFRYSIRQWTWPFSTFFSQVRAHGYPKPIFRMPPHQSNPLAMAWDQMAGAVLFCHEVDFWVQEQSVALQHFCLCSQLDIVQSQRVSEGHSLFGRFFANREPCAVSQGS